MLVISYKPSVQLSREKLDKFSPFSHLVFFVFEFYSWILNVVNVVQLYIQQFFDLFLFQIHILHVKYSKLIPEQPGNILIYYYILIY